MKLKTRVFELWSGDLTELARAMGISSSQIYRVRQGRRAINEKFIIGAIKAFPGHELADLFYVAPEGSQNEVMLTISDVVRLLGLHPNTVRRWNKKGILKSYRTSPRGHRRFRREDVDGFLKKGEIE